MLFRQTLAAGVNFDGSAGQGFVDFPTIAPVPGDDGQRVKILTFAIGIGQGSNNSRLKNVYVVFAETLNDAVDDGAGWIFHALTDVHEFVSTTPVILLPNWSGFVFAEESVGSFVKSVTIDYVRVNLQDERGYGPAGGGGC